MTDDTAPPPAEGAGRLLARKTLAMIEGGKAQSEMLPVTLAVGTS